MTADCLVPDRIIAAPADLAYAGEVMRVVPDVLNPNASWYRRGQS